MPRALILLAGPAGFALGAVLGLVGFDALRRRALLARRLLAVAAGAAAVFAPPAATGLGPWDAVLRAGFASGFVVLAGRSRPVWWVPAAALASIGMIGAGALLAAALALLGAAAALAANARRLPMAGAVIGTVLVQVSMRLEWPARTGATAALAALALLPVAASGLRHSPRRSRRIVTRMGLAAGVVLGLGLGSGVAAVLLAHDDFVTGTRALDAGVAAVRRADQPGTARQLSQAHRSFDAARDTLDAGWLLPGRLVPVVAQHVSALQQAARTGSDLALTGAETVAASRLPALRLHDGRMDLAGLRALRDPVATAVAGIDRAHRTLVAAGDTPWLVAPLADRLHREIARLDQSGREAATVLAVTERLPALLGGDGHRRYFLAIQSPAEARGSGGIVGSYGEVSADRGALVVGNFGRDGDLDTKGTPPGNRTLPGPADYRARYARFEPQRIWQNVSVSPDFPSVAEVIAGLYPQSGGSAVDGVISVDPAALAALLQLVGPVTVAPWPEPITAANAEHVLMFDQYVRLEGTARTDFLGDVARAVAGRLTTGELPPPAALVAALSPAVRGHHLALWSRRPAEQELFRRIGADSGLPPVDGDSLAVVDNNSGGNKLDWFLRRRSAYQARVDPGTGDVTASLTVTLHNEAPAAGLPAYVIGSSIAGSSDAAGANRTYLSVYSPFGLVGARLDGTAVPVESAREAGRNVYSLFLVVPPGGTRTVTFGLSGRLPPDRPYRLTWRAQPLAFPEIVSAQVNAGRRPLVTRPAGPLGRDRTDGPPPGT